MRINMEGEGIKLDMTIRLQWIIMGLIGLSLTAGVVMYRSEANQKDIETLQTEFRKSLDSQVISNNQLRVSIVTLNSTLVTLEKSLIASDNDLEELTEAVDRHDREISEIKGRMK